jgi:hypothetical protein
MRKLLLLSFLFFGCVHSNVKQVKVSSPVDSVIFNSKNTMKMADSVGKKSDSSTKKKIQKTVEKIKYLTKELVITKKEVNTLTNKKNVIIHDTVYIESEKNFWGKKKTKVNVVTDSVQTETTDTLTK